MSNRKERILVAGPYVGEFGWEVFSWQPLVRAAFLSGRWDRCLSYVGPGRQWLYRFAETRTLPNMPKHEPECLAYANLPAHKVELEALMNTAVEAAKAEMMGMADIGTINYASIPSLNDPMYANGQPDLLRPDRFITRGGGAIVLCVRDRALSDHRNWSYVKWAKLAGLLIDEGLAVTVVGHITKPNEWQMPSGVVDLTNKTTIDDLIQIFSMSGMAIGGSTGTLHLASRCGCDHIAWGAENATRFPLSNRYAETNWFGAKHSIITDFDWNPEPEAIVEEVEKRTDQWARDRSKGRVLVTFDDASADHYQAAKLMSSFGLTGVFAVVTGKTDTVGFCTWEQLREMSKAGHCICNHGHTHARIRPDAGRPHLAPVGPNGVLADALMAKEELERRGLDGSTYVAPFGTDNVDGPKHLEEFLKHFRTIRLTTGAPHERDGWIPTGMHRHYPVDFAGPIWGITCAADCRWPGRIRQRLDECALAGTTCVLLYHRVDHVVGETMNLTWKEFEADMQYLAKMAKDGKVEVGF